MTAEPRPRDWVVVCQQLGRKVHRNSRVELGDDFIAITDALGIVTDRYSRVHVVAILTADPADEPER